MAWIEVHQSLPGHRKTLKAAAMLRIDPVQMTGHMVTLWLWGLDNAPDGCIGGEPWMIAHAAGWRGDPEAFLEALHQAQFAWVEGEPSQESWNITNWHEYAGKLIDRRAANVQRMREARALHGARTVHERAELPNRTVPNPTVPNSTEEGEAVTPPARKLITPDFIEEMVEKYKDQLGGDAKVREQITEALNHTAFDKRKDKRVYLDGWLRRNATRQRPTVGSRADVGGWKNPFAARQT